MLGKALGGQKRIPKMRRKRKARQRPQFGFALQILMVAVTVLMINVRNSGQV